MEGTMNLHENKELFTTVLDMAENTLNIKKHFIEKDYWLCLCLQKENQMPKRLRTLDPLALSFICMLSDTNKEDYRCYQFRQSNPTLWNS